MSIKKSQAILKYFIDLKNSVWLAILKCFIDLKNSVWFITLGSENETMFYDTSEQLFWARLSVKVLKTLNDRKALFSEPIVNQTLWDDL